MASVFALSPSVRDMGTRRKESAIDPHRAIWLPDMGRRGCMLQRTMNDEIISLCGPIEREGPRLVIRIPLDQGGGDLHLVCQQISEIDGDDLVVPIPDWLAEKIQVGEGTMIYVDNRGGKFNITKAEVE